MGCYLFILASKHPLIIPSEFSVASEGPVRVREFDVEPEWQSLLANRSTYLLSSCHTGNCACGFLGDYLEVKAARRALVEFLEQAVQQDDDLLLLVTICPGDPNRPIVPIFEWLEPDGLAWLPDKLLGRNEVIYQIVASAE